MSDTPIYDELVAYYEAEKQSVALEEKIAEFADSLPREGFDVPEEVLSEIPKILRNAAGHLADELLKAFKSRGNRAATEEVFPYVQGFLDALDLLTEIGPPHELT